MHLQPIGQASLYKYVLRSLLITIGLLSTISASAEQPRLVLSALDEKGQSVIVSDGSPGLFLQNAPDSFMGDLWKIDSLPKTNQSGFKPSAYSLEPKGAGGVSFRIISVPPQTGKQKKLSNDESGMHQTDTIDFITIVSGEVYALMDSGQEVLLKTGDTFIQRGTNHAWVNRGSVPCVFSAVMIKPAIPTLKKRNH